MSGKQEWFVLRGSQNASGISGQSTVEPGEFITSNTHTHTHTHTHTCVRVHTNVRAPTDFEVRTGNMGFEVERCGNPSVLVM
jgi:hypothetical protein